MREEKKISSEKTSRKLTVRALHSVLSRHHITHHFIRTLRRAKKFCVLSISHSYSCFSLFPCIASIAMRAYVFVCMFSFAHFFNYVSVVWLSFVYLLLMLLFICAKQKCLQLHYFYQTWKTKRNDKKNHSYINRKKEEKRTTNQWIQ